MISSQKKQTTSNSDLRTLAHFYRSSVGTSIYDHDQIQAEVYRTWAEVYNPSIKDIEVMKVKSVKAAVTLKMRDPQTGYFPQNNDLVILDDVRYEGKQWQVTDIRSDFNDRRWLIILLNGDSL